MKIFKRGQKVICNSHLWAGKIGRIIEIKDNVCNVAFGDLEVALEFDLIEPFDDEFLIK